MVLKRILSTILIISTVIFIVVLPCFAHPGRTDSNGGRYNHDTGEYHYHNDGSPQNTPQYESGNSSSDEDDIVTTKSFAEWSKEKNKYSDSESDYKSDYNYSSNYAKFFNKELKITKEQRDFINETSGFDKIREPEYFQYVLDISKDIWKFCNGEQSRYAIGVYMAYDYYVKNDQYEKALILREAVGDNFI